MLGIQGKRGMINGTTDFETVLKREEYYITTLDIWVFAQKYNVNHIYTNIKCYKLKLKIVLLN